MRFISQDEDIFMIKHWLEQIRNECVPPGFTIDAAAELRVRL